MSHLEDQMYLQLRASGLPLPRTQWKAIPGRQFRCDFAWPDRMLALEVDGGLYRGKNGQRGPGHTSTKRLLADMEKRSLLAIAGYRVLCVGEKHLKDGRAIEWVRAALGANTPRGLDCEPEGEGIDG